VSNGFASAEQLQAAAGKRRYDETKLPVSGLRVRFRSLKEVELAEYETQVVRTTGRGLRTDRIADATRRFLVLCMVDGAGNPLYRSDQADQLKEWDSLDTQHLYEKCHKHVGLEREDIEGLVKKSEATPVGSEPSD
jgi:hypothetical protein